MPVIKPTSLILIEMVANEVAEQCPDSFDIYVDADLCGSTGAYYFSTNIEKRVAWVTVHRVSGSIIVWFARVPDELDLTVVNSRRPGPKLYQTTGNVSDNYARQYPFRQALDSADEEQYAADAAQLIIEWLIQNKRPEFA